MYTLDVRLCDLCVVSLLSTPAETSQLVQRPDTSGTRPGAIHCTVTAPASFLFDIDGKGSQNFHQSSK